METILKQQLFTYSTTVAHKSMVAPVSSLNQRQEVRTATSKAAVVPRQKTVNGTYQTAKVYHSTMSIADSHVLSMSGFEASRSMNSIGRMPTAPSVASSNKYEPLATGMWMFTPRMNCGVVHNPSSFNAQKLIVPNHVVNKTISAMGAPTNRPVARNVQTHASAGDSFMITNYDPVSRLEVDNEFMTKSFGATRRSRLGRGGRVTMSAAATSGDQEVSADAKHKVVFVRHGESTWNQENRFTGWTDVPLSELGEQEALEAGKLIKDAGIKIDVGYTSLLQRAAKTYQGIGQTVDLKDVPLATTYRLNERHYGALQGLNKAETAAMHGEDQVKIWRRSFDVPPPPLELNDERHPRHDALYKNLADSMLPAAESLKCTIERVMPYWFEWIVPQIMLGKTPLVVAHGNSLRAIVKALNNMSEEEILEYNIPTAVPLVFEFDGDMNVQKHYYLLDEEAVKAKQDAVANQGKAK